MPLRKDSKRRSDGGDSDSMTTDVLSSTTNQQNYEEEEEEEETQDAWLKSLGVENSEIKKINNSQVFYLYIYMYIIIIYCVLYQIHSNVMFCFRRE